jgi:hypothetical protein
MSIMQLHLALKLRMSAAVSVLRLYAFMVWTGKALLQSHYARFVVSGLYWH